MNLLTFKDFKISKRYLNYSILPSEVKDLETPDSGKNRSEHGQRSMKNGNIQSLHEKNNP